MKSFKITASILEPYLFQNFVEQLADFHYQTKHNKEITHQGWETIDTSSVEAHVKVGLHFSNKISPAESSHVTIFLFTCTRKKDEQFKFRWCHSLS